MLPIIGSFMYGDSKVRVPMLGQLSFHKTLENADYDLAGHTRKRRKNSS